LQLHVVKHSGDSETSLTKQMLKLCWKKQAILTEILNLSVAFNFPRPPPDQKLTPPVEIIN
jgi:hypothetical protein